MAQLPSEIVLVAQASLDMLGRADAHWIVISVDPYPDSSPDPKVMLVRAAKVEDPSCEVSAYIAQAIPTQDAIAQLASGLQDEVIEAVRAPVPACEGHPRPMAARVEDERAVWMCPAGGGAEQEIVALRAVADVGVVDVGAGGAGGVGGVAG